MKLTNGRSNLQIKYNINIYKDVLIVNKMTETAQLEYRGKIIEYKTPLGIYLDGKITGRIHDSIIPKYEEISAQKLSLSKLEDIRKVRDDAVRQLEEIAQDDTEEVRISLKNTIDLTNSILE